MGSETMSAIPKKLEDEAMRLPAELRARLAERLIASLDQKPAEADAEGLWIDEAQRRAQELAAGAVEEIPSDQALATARAALL
jgi:hypothetical protein